MSLDAKFRKNFEIDLRNLGLLVDRAADILKYGTRAQRRPDLGRMVTCPYCRQRKLQAVKCCDPRYATTKRAWDPEKGFYQDECPERVHESFIGKTLLRRLRHKKHGQNRRNALRAFTLHLMDDDALVYGAAIQMCVPVPDRASLPSFAQKFWLWLEEREDKRIRGQRDVSRRVNAGHAKGGDRFELSRPRNRKKREEKNERNPG